MSDCHFQCFEEGNSLGGNPVFVDNVLKFSLKTRSFLYFNQNPVFVYSFQQSCSSFCVGMSPSNSCLLQVMIFFSAHGVPLAYVEEAGDPYKVEMEECVDLIMEELETRKITNPYTLAYQVTPFCFLSSWFSISSDFYYLFFVRFSTKMPVYFPHPNNNWKFS